MKTIKTFIADETGATAIEYALIATLVAIGIIGALTTLGGTLSGTYTRIGTSLPASR